MPVRRWAIWFMKHDGTIMGQVSPENLHVTWNKGENGPHEVTFEVPDAYPGFDVAKILPYNVDFALVLDDVPIMKGMVTSTAFESEENYASIACKDWLHYLERRFFPFDPLNPNAFRVGNPPRGLAYETPETDDDGFPTGPTDDITTIVKILLDYTLSMPNSLPIVHRGWVPWNSTGVTPLVPQPPPGLLYMVNDAISVNRGSWWGDFPHPAGTWIDLPFTGYHPTGYSIDLGDTETILSKIQQLSQMGDGTFDFWVDQDKTFHMAVPRHYDINVLADATLAHWVFRDSDSGLLKVNWGNNGPLGNHLFGHASSNVYYWMYTYRTDTGQILESEKWVESVNLGLNIDDPATENTYRRLDADEDFGEVVTRSDVNNLTKGFFPRTNNPSYECSVEIVADAVPDLFKGRIFPGCAIWIDYTHPLYHINSAWEVVSMELEVTTETEENVTLNLNQIYPRWQEPAPPYQPPSGFIVQFPPTEPPQVTQPAPRTFVPV